MDIKGLLFSLIKPAAPSGSVNLPFQYDTNGPNTTVSVSAPIATSSAVGLVKPDGTTVTVDSGGKISAAGFPNASSSSVLLGSGSSGAGSPYAPIVLGSGLGMSGTTLNVTTGASSTGQPVLRGTSGNYSAVGGNITVSFPSGVTANDEVVVFLSANYTAATPTGWTLLTSQVQSVGSWSTWVFSKRYAASDGPSVTFTMSGTTGNYKAAWGVAALVGSTVGGVRENPSGLVNQGSATTQTINTSANVQATDYALYWGSNQLDSGAISESISRGTVQQSPTGGDLIGVLATEALTASGSYGVTFTTGSGGSNYGAFGGIVVIYGVSGMQNPMTAQGDMIVGGPGGAPDRVAGGASTYVWTSNGPTNSPSWQPSLGSSGGVSTYVWTSNGPTYSPSWQPSPGGSGGGSLPGPTLTAPVAVTFAWVNQGTATSNTSGSQLSIYAPSVTGVENLRILEQSLPGSTWTLTAAISHGPILTQANYASVGIGVKDSGNAKMIFFKGHVYNGGALSVAVTEYSNATTGVSNHKGPTGWFYAPSQPYMWLRIIADATNFTFYYSMDGGNDWTQYDQIGVAAYLSSPATAFFCVNADTANPNAASLVSWKFS